MHSVILLIERNDLCELADQAPVSSNEIQTVRSKLWICTSESKLRNPNFWIRKVSSGEHALEAAGVLNAGEKNWNRQLGQACYSVPHIVSLCEQALVDSFLAEPESFWLFNWI